MWDRVEGWGVGKSVGGGGCEAVRVLTALSERVCENENENENAEYGDSARL